MRYLLILCVMMMFHTGYSQKTFIGLKAGGHSGSAFIDHTIFSNINNAGFKGGFHGSLLFKYFPKERDVFLKSGLQFSVNYVRKGWTQVFLTAEPTYSAEMTYVEFPVEAIGFFGNKNNYFITLGFFFEYLLDYNLSDDPTLDTDLNGNEIPNSVEGQDFYTFRPERDNRAGYGARASGGIFREFSFGMVHLEGFFSYSISNFIEAGDLTTGIPDISNLWYAGVSLGYLIPLKRGIKELPSHFHE